VLIKPSRGFATTSTDALSKRISSMPSPLRERCESAEARLGQVPSELLRVHHQRSGGHRSRE
jgi:hypothetical protein